MASKVARAPASAHVAADKQKNKKTNTQRVTTHSQKSNSKIMIRVSRTSPGAHVSGTNEAALERLPGWLPAETGFWRGWTAELFGENMTVGELVRDIVDRFKKKQKRFRKIVDSISRRSVGQMKAEYPFFWASLILLAGAVFLSIVAAVFTILTLV